MARLLIDRGADVAQAWNDQTPLDIAKGNGHEEIVRLLEARDRA